MLSVSALSTTGGTECDEVSDRAAVQQQTQTSAGWKKLHIQAKRKVHMYHDPGRMNALLLLTYLGVKFSMVSLKHSSDDF